MDSKKEKQLKQLKQIQQTFDRFVKVVENGKIEIVDGGYTDEINIDNDKRVATNCLSININYIEKYI